MPHSITADQLDRLREEFGEDNVLIYSGRGMFGAQCIGYTGDHVGDFIVSMAAFLFEWPDKVETSRVKADIDRLFRCMSTDAMGLDTVYYWRSICVDGD